MRHFVALSSPAAPQAPVPAVLKNQPSMFTIDGKQNVAVMSGWGGDAPGVQARLNGLRPGEFPEVPDGGAIWVFALPGDERPSQH